MSLQDTDVLLQKIYGDIGSAIEIFLKNYGSIEEFCSSTVKSPTEEEIDPQDYIYLGAFIGGGMIVLSMAMVCCAWYCLPLIAAALCAATAAKDSDSDDGGNGCGSNGGSGICGNSGSGICGNGGPCGQSGCCNFDIDLPECDCGDCASCKSCGSCGNCGSCGDCCNCCECCNCCDCCNCCCLDCCQRRRKKKKKQEEEEEDQEEDIILAGKLFYQENQNMSLNPYEI